MLWTFFFLCFLIKPSQSVGELSPATGCLDGIVTALGKFTFSPYHPSRASFCTNNLSMYSMWTAAKVYCTPAEIEAGYMEYGRECLLYRAHLVPYSEVEPKLTNTYIRSLPVVNFEDTKAFKVWNDSILISPSLYKAAKRTVVSDHSNGSWTFVWY